MINWTVWLFNKGTRGADNLLYLDKHNLMELITKQKNVTIIWIDNKRLMIGFHKLGYKNVWNVQNIWKSYKFIKKVMKN